MKTHTHVACSMFPLYQNPLSLSLLSCLIMVSRLYGRLAPMYESGGTRMFKLGRTDTIRNTTIEAQTFVNAMENPNVSVSAYVY